MSIGLWHLQFSCPSASNFHDFGYDWYFKFTLFEFQREKKNLNSKSVSLRTWYFSKVILDTKVHNNNYIRSHEEETYSDNKCICHNYELQKKASPEPASL